MNYDSETANDKGFYFRINGQNCKIMSYKGNDDIVTVPDKINNKPVRVIGKRAFAYKEFNEIILPDGINKIEEEAFAGCMIRTVKLPKTIEKIGKNAFGECDKLENVFLEENNSKIDVNWHAFSKTPFIEKPQMAILGNILLRVNYTVPRESLNIPDGIRMIAEAATDNISDNWKIKNIFVPKTVDRIEDRAFSGLDYIDSVEIEGSQIYHYILFGKDVFGKMFRYNNFRNKIIRRELGRINIYSDTKVQTLKKIELRDYGRSFGECQIYIPPSKRKEFWELLQIDYRGYFYFSLQLRDYYKLMLEIPSVKEQLEMCSFLLQHVYTGWRRELIQFFQIHINKAVEYAIKENDVEQLKIYNHLKLFEKGLNKRHLKYLFERYQNKASQYLKKTLENTL